jgi:hypothetical protein
MSEVLSLFFICFLFYLTAEMISGNRWIQGLTIKEVGIWSLNEIFGYASGLLISNESASSELFFFLWSILFYSFYYYEFFSFVYNIQFLFRRYSGEGVYVILTTNDNNINEEGKLYKVARRCPSICEIEPL